MRREDHRTPLVPRTKRNQWLHGANELMKPCGGLSIDGNFTPGPI